GGPSAEREVSLKSGAAVAAALRAGGHTVREIDPKFTDVAKFDWRGIDVAFLALHGEFGEDGTVQDLLDTLGIPYTGSGANASRISFSKLAAKQRFVQNGVPTPPWLVVDSTLSPGQCAAQARRLGFPLVVKPDQQGSSLGVTIVRDEEQLGDALEIAFGYGRVVVLEQAIDGAEWTVGLLDSHPLPPIRIGTDHTFFDYDAKYHADDTRYQFDDDGSGVAAMVSRVARDACAAVGTKGVARVDVMVDRLGRPFVLEVNTIPGFTDHSLVPKAAAHAGMNFVALCEWCVTSALARDRGRRAA
ncbi:MAG: D-alanine--D-alanine ligase, partial [Planctomycetota bacterium]|nr:D-alanine--D-alanine ligase [Planctomycetota bacterium]